MQDNEVLILEEIEKNPNTTQRDLSEKTGLSLGMVNLLLKKFVKKGFVKLEKLNSRSFRYILTPEGFKEKSKKTIVYMKRYYQKTLLIKQALCQYLGWDFLKSRSITIFTLIFCVMIEMDRITCILGTLK